VGVDALVQIESGQQWTGPATTLHDVRWGEHTPPMASTTSSGSSRYRSRAGFALGWGIQGAVSERQPSMYFRLGGGTLKGICKPGEVVWSRVYVEGGSLKVDMGRATAISLPKEETDRRWREVTRQCPSCMFCSTAGSEPVHARHPSNHVNVAYAPTAEEADLALAVKSEHVPRNGR